MAIRGETVGRAFVRLFIDGSGLDEQVEKELHKADPAAERAGKEHGRRYSKGFGDELDHKIERLSHITGKAFGKGSRNNFLNFLGSSVEGLTRLVGLPLKVGVEVGKFTKTISDAIGKGEGFVSMLARSGGGLASLVTGLAAAGAAAAALVVAIGLLVTVASLAVGAIVALASSLTFALLGALTAVGGALGVLTLGIGFAVLAFTNLSKAQKTALSQAVKPLTAGFKSLGEAAAAPILRELPAQLGRLAPVLSGLEPLARGVGKAISDVIDALVNSLNSPAFAAFKSDLTKFLPNAVRLLGTSFVNALGGLGGLFRAAMPLTREFLTWLDKITGKFNEWVNSDEGQEKMKSFFDRAGESAKEVGRALGEITKLLGTIFSGTKEGGDSLFTSLGDAAERFNKFLKDNPEALSKWADDAATFARALGDVVVFLGEVVDFLDNELTRAIVTNPPFLVAKRAVDSLNESLGKIGLSVGELATKFTPIGALVTGLKKAWDAAGGLNGILTSLKGALTAIVPSQVVELANNLKRGWDSADGLRGALGTIKSVVSAIVPASVSILASALKRGWDNAGGLKGVLDGIKNMVLNLPGLAGVREGLRLASDHAESLRALLKRIKDFTFGITGLGLAVSALNNAAEAARRLKSLLENIKVPKIGVPRFDVPGFASGGLVTQRTFAEIGEAGREAVVPLDRPLSQIDPAVRELAAFAQGRLRNGSGSNNNSRNIDVGGITINTPTEDPRAVARETINMLAAAGY